VLERTLGAPGSTDIKPGYTGHMSMSADDMSQCDNDKSGSPSNDS
jgi:hypothetical protein